MSQERMDANKNIFKLISSAAFEKVKTDEEGIVVPRMKI